VTQPTLATDRLQLIPLADDHIELEVELDSDPEVLLYLHARARTREEVEQAHRRRISAAQEIPGLGFWVGFVDGEFVGWWILQPPNGADQPKVPGEADLGYRLLRRWWRQGLASEGARELLRYGFEDVGLSRIFAQTMTVNEGSRAVMSAIGMNYVRTFPGDFEDPLPGSAEGEVEYAIDRHRWALARGFELAVAGRPAILRRLTVADAVPFAAHIAGDLSRLGEHLPWPAATSSVDGARAWLENHELARDGRVIAVGAWEESRLLGGAVLFHHEPASAAIELGCWVVAEAEGRGIAAACCVELLELARSGLRAERVEWRTTPANMRSRRLAERLGFRYEGRLRSRYVLREARLDVDVLSLVGAEIDAAIDQARVLR
jgi:RimJ/RimL family protein N-acetyltransferase